MSPWDGMDSFCFLAVPLGHNFRTIRLVEDQAYPRHSLLGLANQTCNHCLLTWDTFVASFRLLEQSYNGRGEQMVRPFRVVLAWLNRNASNIHYNTYHRRFHIKKCGTQAWWTNFRQSEQLFYQRKK